MTNETTTATTTSPITDTSHSNRGATTSLLQDHLGLTGEDIIGKLQAWTQLIGSLLLGYILMRILFVNLYLLLRWIRIRFGSRIKPSPDKAIVITGATSGFGLCLAKRLHKLGFTVFACYYSELEAGFAELKALNDGDQEEPAAKLTSLVDKPNRMILIPLDVSSQESIASCHAAIISHLDEHSLKLHALVNNAGCAFDGPFQWAERKCIQKVINTNLAGPIMMARQFVTRIVHDQGRFVNVSSGIEIIPCKSVSIYGATKSGIAYFSEALHLDLAEYGVASYCILPGNLMQATNIIFTRHKGLQDSIAALTEDERWLYRRSIDQCQRLSEIMIDKRLKRANLDLDEIERIYGLSLDGIRQRRAIQASISGSRGGKCSNCRPDRYITKYLASLTRFMIAQGSGSATGKSLDDSGILLAFEAALLMKDAPKRHYMGSPLFTYVVGPLAEVLPPLFYRVLSIMAYDSFVSQLFNRTSKS